MVSKHFFPFPGGLEVRVLELARWMVQNKQEALVLTSKEPKTPSCEDVEGIEVRRSKVLLNIFNALICPGVVSDLFTQEYDLIDVNLPDPFNAVSCLLASVLRKKPLVVTYHADIVKEGTAKMIFKTFYQPIQNLVLKHAKVIMVTSPNYARQSKTLIPHMKKVKVASSFIDLKRFNPDIDGSTIRKRYDCADEALILFVGRLVPYKGIGPLIGAISKMGDDFNAKLLIVGGGPLEKKIKDQVKDAGLDGKIVFCENVQDDELPRYYRACDIFILPSINRAEAFGLVLVEAMACKKPLITSNFSGMPYVAGDDNLKDLTDGVYEAEAGLLVEKEDQSSLIKAIKLLLEDEGLRLRLGENGSKRANRLFTRDVVCKNILRIYEQALETLS